MTDDAVKTRSNRGDVRRTRGLADWLGRRVTAAARRHALRRVAWAFVAASGALLAVMVADVWWVLEAWARAGAAAALAGSTAAALAWAWVRWRREASGPACAAEALRLEAAYAVDGSALIAAWQLGRGRAVEATDSGERVAGCATASAALATAAVERGDRIAQDLAGDADRSTAAIGRSWMTWAALLAVTAVWAGLWGAMPSFVGRQLARVALPWRDQSAFSATRVTLELASVRGAGGGGSAEDARGALDEVTLEARVTRWGKPYRAQRVEWVELDGHGVAGRRWRMTPVGANDGGGADGGDEVGRYRRTLRGLSAMNAASGWRVEADGARSEVTQAAALRMAGRDAAGTAGVENEDGKLGGGGDGHGAGQAGRSQEPQAPATRAKASSSAADAALGLPPAKGVYAERTDEPVERDSTAGGGGVDGADAVPSAYRGWVRAYLEAIGAQ